MCRCVCRCTCSPSSGASKQAQDIRGEAPERPLSLNEGKRQYHPLRSQSWQQATTHGIQFLDFFFGHNAHLSTCQVERSRSFKMTVTPFPLAGNVTIYGIANGSISATPITWTSPTSTRRQLTPTQKHLTKPNHSLLRLISHYYLL